jgi:hypothetical protein
MAHGKGDGPGSRALGIGIDFDNTLVSYDDLMFETAVGWGLVDAGSRPDKKSVRDLLRRLPDGESHWRRLQTFAYGIGMSRARPMEGVRDFLAFCRSGDIPVWVVSHKSEYNNFGPPEVNLREAALRWLVEQGFFEAARTGLDARRVFFESTREEKVARIAALGPSHFIDDLEETFLEPTFPAGVAKIHYVPHGEPSVVEGALHAASWQSILEHVRSLAVARGKAPRR